MADVTSYEIITECQKYHGAGKLFFRSDGLQNEERRDAQRHRFLEANPGIGTERRKQILSAGVTPGMTRGEATAAWGLLDEDTRNVFGHVTEAPRTTYAYFTGFDVGTIYTLYMINEVVAGVRETEELIQPHKQELLMRLAERFLGLLFFYEGQDGRIWGSDMSEYKNPPDILAMGMHRMEVIPNFLEEDRATRDLLEWRLVGKGVYSDYKEALRQMGTDENNATPEQRCEAALAVKPLPDVSWLFTMP